MVATGPEVDVEDLPAALRRSHPIGTTPGRRPFAQRDRAYIRAVIERHQGNRRRSAEELGISLSTLKRRLRLRPRTL